jgi:hypothetical protein
MARANRSESCCAPIPIINLRSPEEESILTASSTGLLTTMNSAYASRVTT